MTTEVSSIPEVISPRLIDHGIEVGAKLAAIDVHVCCGQRRDFRPEITVRRPDRKGRSSATGSPFFVTTNVSPAVTASITFAFLVAQLSLRDCSRHTVV